MKINVTSVWHVRYMKVLNFKVRPLSRKTGFVSMVRSLIQSLDHCFPFVKYDVCKFSSYNHEP